MNFRKQLGDLTDLRNDIARNGLRRPLVVSQGVLLSGWRRKAACEKLRITPSVREVSTLIEACELIKGDLQGSLPMLPTEMMVQALALEDLDADRAWEYGQAVKKATRSGTAKPKHHPPKAELIWPAVGFSSAKNYERMRTIVASLDGPLDKLARQELENVDETGIILTSYDKLMVAKRRLGDTRKPSHNKNTLEYKQRAKAAAERAWRTLHHLDSSTNDLDAELVKDGTENIETMLRMVGDAMNNLNRFQKGLRK